MPQESPSSETAALFVPDPAVLLAGRMLTATERLLTFRRADGRAIEQQPGQFVQVSIFGMEEAPISVCCAAGDDATFDLCVRRIGRVTGALHELKAGEQIGVRGPFGRGFPVEDLAGKDLLLVAGGIGLAPLRSLIQHCAAHRERFGRVTLLHGAKQPAELLFQDEYEPWRGKGIDVQLIVDAGDAGWTGRVGLITELIPPVEVDPARAAAAVVGPPIMYRFVIGQLNAKGLPPDRIVLSLERHMRCGVGKCGHCMIDNLYCCRDGPVFKLSELGEVREAF